MIVIDNFVHGDLHPGNVFIRQTPQKLNVFDRIRSFIFFGGVYSDMPQVVFLDAGITAGFPKMFFQGIL